MDNPNPEFPAAVNAHLVQSSSHPPLYRESLSEEEEAIGAGSDQVAASVMHDEVARLSSRGVNRTVPGASHRIMLSAPQAVIDAVDEVVTEVRQQRAADVASKERVR